MILCQHNVSKIMEPNFPPLLYLACLFNKYKSLVLFNYVSVIAPLETVFDKVMDYCVIVIDKNVYSLSVSPMDYK